MTFEAFNEAHAQELEGALLALWYDHHGDWNRAHEVAQLLHDADSAWVHGYLHRKEGDVSNAAYWYRRASRPVVTGSLVQEWEAMVREMLGRH